jgi:hypothetical protein
MNLDLPNEEDPALSPRNSTTSPGMIVPEAAKETS